MITTLFCLAAYTLTAQISIQQVEAGHNTSLRGMSIPQQGIIWVSGSNGSVGRSVDEGRTWRWTQVPGFEKTDFRDIEAFDSSRAVIMAIGNPALIFKTNDGGATWKKTFEKNEEGMFLDAMDFKNEKEGICIGDPLQVGPSGKKLFYIIKSNDGGDSWSPLPLHLLPPAENGEAIFSASGTNIAFLSHPDFEFAFVTGGSVSRLLLMGRAGKPNKVVGIPINQGVNSAGTFSMGTNGQHIFYCVGGDYKEPANQYDNFYYSKDGGKKWASSSAAPPFGYRSCIRMVDEKRWVACGTNGLDYTTNGGKLWKDVSHEGFNVCMVSADKKTIYLAGGKGKIAKMMLP